MRLTAHHVGCVTTNLVNGLETFYYLLSATRRTRIFDVTSQGARVCFIELVAGFYLELIQPSTKEIHGTKHGYYHLCYLVENLNSSSTYLRSRSFVPFPTFQSEAFAGCRCQFLLTPQQHLIELAEMSPDDFTKMFDASVQ